MKGALYDPRSMQTDGPDSSFNKIWLVPQLSFGAHALIAKAMRVSSVGWPVRGCRRYIFAEDLRSPEREHRVIGRICELIRNHRVGSTKNI